MEREIDMEYKNLLNEIAKLREENERLQKDNYNQKCGTVRLQHEIWDANTEHGRLKDLLEQTEYRLMNWQQTAEAHANCAESQGKKAAALQSWLDKISEPQLKWMEDGGKQDTTYYIHDSWRRIGEYLDSQKPSERSSIERVHHYGLDDSCHEGKEAECPTCNPKPEKVLHIMEQVYGKPKFILFGDKKPPEWEQSPQDINLIHKYFYET